MFIEHRLLYAQKTKQAVPEGDHTTPIGVADVKREGADATIVGIGYQMGHCLEAAEGSWRERESSAKSSTRVSLSPLDVETIMASVRKTSRCVIVEEGHLRSGVGAEISAAIQESVFRIPGRPHRPRGRAHGANSRSDETREIRAPQHGESHRGGPQDPGRLGLI